jgi:4-hydroxythreonine-4-phosphate dehydrogenase
MEIHSDKQKSHKPVIGITLGDINGIGPEVMIRALCDTRIMNMITPVVFGSTKVLSYYRKLMDLEDLPYSQIRDMEHLSPKRINVVNCWPENVEVKLGQVTEEAGQCAFQALEEAVKYLKNNDLSALVTGPINKKNIQSEHFRFPGHTEYLTEKLGARESLMMMVRENFRVAVVTGHVPLNQVAATLTRELLEKKIRIYLDCLRSDFRIEKPRIAVLGLNPHAGEEGLLGLEEQEILAPVIGEFKKKGALVFGPFPADGFFGALQFQKYDGVLAMYHDQGLVPFKLLGFENGVNYTAGLPKVRTSPDHGTAYTLAGKNTANADSALEAVYLAASIARNRQPGS